jgi:hypothetical protein
MKRRFIQQLDGTLVEVSPDFVAEPQNHDGVLWNDRAYQDAGDSRFSSRSQHREFMRARGLTTTDDFKNQWRTDEKNRIEARKGVDPSRKADIARAIEVVNSRRKS